MSDYTRRDFIKTTSKVIGLTGANAAFYIPELFSEETEALRIGYLPIIDAAPLLVAYANGYFKDEGLKPQRPRMIRSWSTLSESFMANKFNLVHLLFPIPLWMRYQNRIPVKILAWDHTNGSAITVKADSGINTFADLGGKQIAVPYWYSMHNMILQMGIRKAGLTPVIQPHNRPLKKNQVNLFVLSPPQMAPSLLGGKIDGYIVAEPFNALAELKIKARIMRFVGDIWKNHPCCVVVMKETIVRTKPVFTAKVVNAIARAQLWINHNREKAAKMLSRDETRLLPQNYEVLHQALSEYSVETYGGGMGHAIRHPEWKINRVDFQPYPYPSATRLILKEMKQTLVEGNADFLRQLDPHFVETDLIEKRFVKEAINNLGGLTKFPNMDLTRPWEREEIIDFAG